MSGGVIFDHRSSRDGYLAACNEWHTLYRGVDLRFANYQNVSSFNLYLTFDYRLCFRSPKKTTVNPQKRPAGLILSLSVQMRVLLEFCQTFVFLPIVF